MELIPLISENNAESTLDSGINASTVTIPLVSGGGSDFPTTYNGTATSAGTATALNDTGIGSSGLSVGDHIYNVTDGSHAVVTAVNTDDVVTTTLEGGSDNTWDSGDEWAANMFVVTMNKRNADGQVTQQEMALVQERSTDTLTIMAGKRGYGNSSAQSFESGDYVNLFATWELFENIQKLALQNATNIETKAETSTVTALLNARNWKQSVVCATTAAGTLASDFENGDTVDGITLSTGDRILIKDQVDATENGVYTVNASGAPTRATDFDNDSEIVAAVTIVEEGTTNADVIFICTNTDGDEIGTDDINFSTYNPANAGSITGEIRLWATAAAPAGWKICNGDAISRTSYSDLFAVISTDYGAGDGSTTFNLPDLRGRAAIGSGTGDATDATAHALADKEGTEGVTLTSAESGLPAHSHPQQYLSGAGSMATIQISSPAESTPFSSIHSTALNTAADAASAHDNMQPSLTLNYIIKT